MKHLIKIICAVVFFVCLYLIIAGQKNIGYVGAGSMILGLCGLLGLLFYYNQKNR